VRDHAGAGRMTAQPHLTTLIVAAVIGMIFLKERFGARRVAAAVVIAAGIVLIST
jgi:drug/metabolite transporter (DMT)-like permease